MEIYGAIGKIMVDVDAIGKNQKNQQQGFKFRGIDDVYNAIHPLFAKHGVFSVPTVLEERVEERVTKSGSNLIYRVLKIKYTFYAQDGSSVDAVVIGEGMDSGDKASNKAMAVGHKYALLQLLCIPTEDMVDPDSETQQQSTKKPDKFEQLHLDYLLKLEKRVVSTTWDDEKKNKTLTGLRTYDQKTLNHLDDVLEKEGK